MKHLNLFAIFVAIFLISLHYTIDGCKIRDTPQVIEGSVKCIADKFLKLLPFAGAGDGEAVSAAAASTGWKAPKDVDNSPIVVSMLKHTFRKFGNQLDLLDRIMEGKDDAEQADAEKQMEDFLKDKTTRQSVLNYFQLFLSSLVNSEQWFQQMLNNLDSYDSDEALLFLEDLQDVLANATLPTEFICAVLKNQTGIDACHILQCLSKYDETDFEDTIGWTECLFKCEDLLTISPCVYGVINEYCPGKPRLGATIVKIFMGLIGIDQSCLYRVKFSHDLHPPINLVEGGEPVMVELQSYVPASVYCTRFGSFAAGLSTVGGRIKQYFTKSGVCNVQFQLSLSNYLTGIVPIINVDNSLISMLPNFVCTGVQLKNAKCRKDNSLLTQAVIGNHTYQSGASCLIDITDENWNTTHYFPLVATVDNKYEKNMLNGGVTQTNFTVKVFVKGSVTNSSKYLVNIHDQDIHEDLEMTCRSVNDPHIITFDGKYFDNFLEGYFLLYRNKILPYQVQVIYQKCQSNFNYSCACAVAVVSYDDVFVLDKCRRMDCVGDSCSVMHTTLYTGGGSLTTGTRIFANAEGLDYKVILPHGTIVKIQVTLHQLNIHIVPSAYDRNNTEGLCGVSNELKEDDFMFPNGTILTADGGIGFQPNEFSHAWRINENDIAFEGLLPYSGEALQKTNYCSCNHVLIKGVQCHCGVNKMIETCDLDLDGEMNTTQLAIIQKRSLKEMRDENPGLAVPSLINDIDINESFSPSAIPNFCTGSGCEWTENKARSECLSIILNHPVANVCPSSDFTSLPRDHKCVTKAQDICVEDIRITQSLAWVQSAIEMMKQCCMEEFDRRLQICHRDLVSIENSTCLNDCSGNGTCHLGVCHCHTGFSGGDCSFSSYATPAVEHHSSTTLCDLRYENCEYVTVNGVNLQNGDDTTLTCTVMALKNTSSGYVTDPEQAYNARTMVISPYQMACLLPSKGSYEVTVNAPKSAASKVASSIVFKVLAADFVCYTCDTATNKCWRKDTADHCIIDGVCYDQYEQSAYDNCSICNPSVNTDGWSDRPDDAALNCSAIRAEQEAIAQDEERFKTIRIGVTIILIIIIILFTLVIFCCQKARGNKEGDIKVNGISHSKNTSLPLSSMSSGYVNGGMVPQNGGMMSHDSVLYETLSPATKMPPGHYSSLPPYLVDEHSKTRTSSMSSGVTDLLKIKQIAADVQQRERANSTGQQSVRSLGIGGGGPIQYGRLNKSVIGDDQVTSMGIGGGHTISHRLPDSDIILTYPL